MAKKKPLFGVNTYVKKTKPKIGRHKKNMNKTRVKKIIKIPWTRKNELKDF